MPVEMMRVPKQQQWEPRLFSSQRDINFRMQAGDSEPQPTVDEILYFLFLEKNIDISGSLKLARGRYSKVITAQTINEAGRSKTIAMKVINTSKVPSWYMKNTLPFDLFTWRNLKHPNVVGLLGHYEALHYVFLTMDYCEGGNMLSFVKKNGPLEVNLLRSWLVQVIEGVGYLHGQQVPHGNLEPRNILIGRHRIKVTGFGLGRDEMDRTTAFVGYRAPEAMEKTPDLDAFKADVWSLGCCFFFMATGQKPFADEGGQRPTVLLNQRLRNYAVEPRVSDRARRSLDSLLTFDPGFRPTMINSTCLPFFH